MRIVAVGLLAALLAACQHSAPTYDYSPSRPTIQIPTTLTLVAVPGVGSTAKQAILTAALHDQAGRGIPSTPLSFSSNKGRLDPGTAMTGASGTATSTLTSGSTTTLTVSGAGLTTTIDVTLGGTLTVSLNVPRLEKNIPATFSATVTGDPDPPLRYLWDFGDGQTATQPSPTHTYADDGRVTIALTVTDGLDRTGSTSSSGMVRDNPEPPPPPDPAPPAPPATLSLVLTCLAHAANVVDCQVAGSFAGAAIPSSFLSGVQWDWGDGATEVGVVARSHKYGVSGTYTIFVNATWAGAPGGAQTATTTGSATAKP